MTERTYVLGGGISGLSAFQRAKDHGHSPKIIERHPALGGLTRSIQVDGFTFDYTGHFLHLRRYETPAAIPFAGLRDENWYRVRRVSRCLVGSAVVDAPIQYNLDQFPGPQRARFIASFLNRRPLEEPTTFKEFVEASFGTELAQKFLIPQNEKTFAIDLDRLEPNAAGRFLPTPPEPERLQRGETSANQTYNSEFWYPRSGGIQRLTDGLRRGVTENDVIWDGVRRIDLRSRTLETLSGRRLEWDRIFTSIPLPSLCETLSERELCNAAPLLSHSLTFCLNLGVVGELPDVLRGVHWVYTPDPSLPFYRVGCYSNISPPMATAGAHCLYVEVGLSHDHRRRPDALESLRTECLGALARLGWLRNLVVRTTLAHVIDCAYVHFTKDREETLPWLVQTLRERGIHPIGRYGMWGYCGMEDSIHSAIEAVDEACTP